MCGTCLSESTRKTVHNQSSLEQPQNFYNNWKYIICLQLYIYPATAVVNFENVTESSDTNKPNNDTFGNDAIVIESKVIEEQGEEEEAVPEEIGTLKTPSLGWLLKKKWFEEIMFEHIYVNPMHYLFCNVKCRQNSESIFFFQLLKTLMSYGAPSIYYIQDWKS